MSSRKRHSDSAGQGDAPRTRNTLGARPKVILDSLTDAVITVGTASLIRGWSEQAARLFGWEPGEVIGRKGIETVIPATDREAHEQEFQAVLGCSDRAHGGSG